MAQTDAVLAALREAGAAGITPLDALRAEDIRSMRLAARINDLRRMGYDIDSRMERTPSGKRVARYRLTEPRPVRQLTLWGDE